MDGTFYQKSGIISGGSLDLARKAKRWDEKHMSQLKAQKEKLTEDLREAMKKSRKESELNTVDSQIRGLETRLKYSTTDMEGTKKQIAAVEVELGKLAKEMEKFGPNMADIERTMAERDQRIEEIKMSMNSVEDNVFEQFCITIGVSNIRQYEERELRMQEQRKKKRLEFAKQINRITSNLEYERNRNTLSNVSRWERQVHDDEEQLESSKTKELKCRNEIDKDMRQVEALKSEKASCKMDCDSMEEEVGKARRDVGAIAKDIQASQKQVVSLENKIESKKSDKHNILKQCKMEDIAIPMLVGNMEDITQETGSEKTSNESSNVTTLNSLNSTEQYEREAR